MRSTLASHRMSSPTARPTGLTHQSPVRSVSATSPILLGQVSIGRGKETRVIRLLGYDPLNVFFPQRRCRPNALAWHAGQHLRGRNSIRAGALIRFVSRAKKAVRTPLRSCHPN